MMVPLNWIVLLSLSLLPGLTRADEACANGRMVDALQINQFAGHETLSVRLGRVAAGRYVKVQQRYVDVAWRIYTEHWQSEVIDSPLGVYGAEYGLIEHGGEAWLCVWGKLANPGELRVELVADADPGLSVRALADRQAGTNQQRRNRYAHAAQVSAHPSLLAEANLAVAYLSRHSRSVAQGIERATLARQLAPTTALQNWSSYVLGSLLSIVDQPDAAREAFAAVLNNDPDDYLHSVTLSYLGLIDQGKGALDAAEQTYNAALVKAGALPQPRGRALNNLGGVALRRGDPHLAASLFHQATIDFRASLDEERALFTLLNNADALLDAGQMMAALKRLSELPRQLPDQFAAAEMFRIYGEVYHALGIYERANASLQLALDRAAQTDSRGLQAALRRVRAKILLSQQDELAAETELRAAMESDRTARRIYGLLMDACHLGDLLLRQGKLAALRKLRDEIAEPLAEADKNTARIATTCHLRLLGGLQIALGDTQSGLENLSSALQQYESMGDHSQIYDTVYRYAQALFGQQDYAGVTRFIELHSPNLQRAALTAAYGPFSRAFVDLQRRLIDLAVVASVAQGETAQALTFSARWRGVQATQQNRPAADAKRDLARRLAFLQHQASSWDAVPSPQELTNYTVQRAALEARLYGEDGGIDATEMPGLDELQQGLQESDAVLYFHLTPEVGFRWLISREAVSVQRIPGDRQLQGPVDRVLEGVLDDHDQGQLEARLATLAEPLLPDFTARRLDKLYVVGDGALHKVPFAALPQTSTGAVLGSTTRVVHLTTLALPRAEDEPFEQATIVTARHADGAFSLPGAAAELDIVRARFKQVTHIATDFVQTPDWSRHPADVLHLSSHAYAHATEPGLSGLMLHADFGESFDRGQVITSFELATMSHPFSLVVLNACETGVGPVSPSQGPMSIATAFLSNGTKHVIATLWRVSDFAAEYFTRHFYQFLQQGHRPDVALHLAKIEMMRAGETRQPKHWAAFRLISS